MREIQINISAAKIKSFSVTLNEDLPDVSATIGLYSGAKKISEFSLCTAQYYGSINFELPAKMVPPIVKLAGQLEEILTLECSRSLGALPEKTVEVKA